jgi:hypothetical protein
MSATSVKLLQAAVEIAGSEEALAARLGIEEGLLLVYLADRRPLPDRLLLRAVDLILSDRQRLMVPGRPRAEASPDPIGEQ